eukprot:TRINITY_DN29708_c0_g1_i1.p1 TRINITY_DN29708_c0_g1~~TRINITY_DN29708_c0_g1_i1.p1  ORF type:complete len:522 (+),score=172.18 TRINITY_DN29708_c0_g1_i1:75-1568(+)
MTLPPPPPVPPGQGPPAPGQLQRHGSGRALPSPYHYPAGMPQGAPPPAVQRSSSGGGLARRPLRIALALAGVASSAFGVLYAAFFRAAPSSLQPVARADSRRVDALEQQVAELRLRLQATERGLSDWAREATLQRESAARYSVHRGACPRGNDLHDAESSRWLTPDQARAACAAHPRCAGFTFESEDKSPSEGVRVFFKREFSVIAIGGWWSYRLEQRPPQPPVPPVVPGFKLWDSARELIRADYDVENLARTGGAREQLWWPEYTQALDPAFQYPTVAEDRLLLSVAPRVYLFPHFFSRDEAQEIIDAARPKLRRSQVAVGKGQKQNDSGVQEIRTSYGAWLNDAVPVVRRVRDRIEAVTQLPRSAFEDLQVLRYEGGQRYGAHFDYFHPRSYGAQNWNRVATFFLYLEDVAVGGETTFPSANGAGGRQGNEECTRGLQIRPRAGAAVLFYSMRPDKNLDPYALHGGCRVGDRQVKWACPQWLRLPLPDGLPPESH